jgi:hypothetical protein
MRQSLRLTQACHHNELHYRHGIEPVLAGSPRVCSEFRAREDIHRKADGSTRLSYRGEFTSNCSFKEIGMEEPTSSSRSVTRNSFNGIRMVGGTSNTLQEDAGRLSW